MVTSATAGLRALVAGVWSQLLLRDRSVRPQDVESGNGGGSGNGNGDGSGSGGGSGEAAAEDVE